MFWRRRKGRDENEQTGFNAGFGEVFYDSEFDFVFFFERRRRRRYYHENE